MSYCPKCGAGPGLNTRFGCERCGRRRVPRLSETAEVVGAVILGLVPLWLLLAAL